MRGMVRYFGCGVLGQVLITGEGFGAGIIAGLALLAIVWEPE